MFYMRNYCRSKILELGEDIVKEVLMESQDLEDARKKLQEMQLRSADIFKRETIECILNYMEAIE